MLSLMATDIEWAWLAGLFEGEGHIGLVGQNSVRLMINMTDLDVLERVRDIAGGTIVTVKEKRVPNHWKPKWCWSLGNQDGVRPALERMKPYLLSRRLARLEEAQQRLS